MPMKRLLLAACLTAVTVAAHAEGPDDRFPKAGTKASRDNPSLLTAVRNWLDAEPATTTRRSRRERAREARRENLRERAQERAHEPPREVAHEPAPEPVQETVREPVRDTKREPKREPVRERAVVVPAPTVAPKPATPPDEVAIIPLPFSLPLLVRPATGASHGCSGGERIISAYYWEGTHTASGARFDPDGMTAAHRTFPFGTRLVVTNPRNGKSVTVTINDRGPFVKGVSLDLSRGAAKAIGLQGTGAVCMERT
jgi:hypothetical protein